MQDAKSIRIVKVNFEIVYFHRFIVFFYFQ